jgi:shikimate kinase
LQRRRREAQVSRRRAHFRRRAPDGPEAPPYTAGVPGSATVWLVGMMGSGKSEVGARLAARLARPFVDTDAEIERAAGASVAQIFAREGEPGFRARERAAIEACAGRAVVVALGGGAIAQPGARDRLTGSGTVVYLRARPETLLARIGDAEGRPLLRGLSPDARRARLSALLEERRSAYESASLVVDTDARTPAEVAGEVAAGLRGRDLA